MADTGVTDIYEWQKDFVISSFMNGMRSDSLGEQPAPWVKAGLEILEKGGELTADKMKTIGDSGGTDHPDPWFG